MVNAASNALPIVVAVAFAAVNLYLAVLWCYAAVRTGLHFARVFAASSALGFLVTVTHLALLTAFPRLQALFGPGQLQVFLNAFLIVQSFVFLLNALGATILVRSLFANYSKEASSNI